MRSLSFVLIVLSLMSISAVAQTVPTFGFYHPLGQVQEFLGLSNAQVDAILGNNNEYNRWTSQKQMRIAQVQSEIADETAKDPVDPMALGVRYAEIEGICRELKDASINLQKKNLAALTDAQRAKLKVLDDAIKLAPVISEAQSAALLGSPYSATLGFATGSSTSGMLIGGIIGGMPGCTVTAGRFSLTIPVAAPAP